MQCSYRQCRLQVTLVDDGGLATQQADVRGHCVVLCRSATEAVEAGPKLAVRLDGQVESVGGAGGGRAGRGDRLSRLRPFGAHGLPDAVETETVEVAVPLSGAGIRGEILHGIELAHQE